MTSAKKRGVLFDIDGTLLDTNYLHVLAWWDAFRDTGHGEIPMTRIHRLIGMGSGQLVAELVGEEDEKTVDAHAKHYEDLHGKAVALPGAADLLEACAAAGRTVVLATSGEKSDLEWMLPAIGAGDAISGVVTSADVDRSKPEPDLLSVAMEKHGLDVEATLMVGDTVWDVAASRNAGLACIGLTSGGISEAELRDAGAAAVYGDPADLRDQLDGSLLG
jgi:HAD superfamily hydrolase (TIGR01509 family)